MSENDKKHVLDINEFLPYQLVKLALGVSEKFAQVYKEEAGLTTPQWRVIAHLAANTSCTAKQLCDLANIDKSTMSRAIKQLIERGIVEQKEDAKDKRSKRVSLSREGKSLYFKLSQKAIEWESSFLDELSEQDRQAFKHILELLNQQL